MTALDFSSPAARPPFLAGAAVSPAVVASGSMNPVGPAGAGAAAGAGTWECAAYPVAEGPAGYPAPAYGWPCCEP